MMGVIGRNISENMRLIAGQLPSLDVTLPSAPWTRRGIWPVGGLSEVGFVSGSELLLVVSSSGRGVLDGRAGGWVARDNDRSFTWFDVGEVTAVGIGPVSEQRIHMAGLAGGGLAAGTKDGWSLDIETFAWPQRSVILKTPNWFEVSNAEVSCTKLAAESELRAAGFSPTGGCLVVATSSEIVIYGRADLSS